MNHSDIAALMKGIAPVIRGLVQPLAKQIADLQEEVAILRGIDHAALAATAAETAVAALPPAPAGKDADPEEIARLIATAVGAIPPAEKGKDADPEVIRSMVAEEVARLPCAPAGKDADMDEVARLIEESVQRAIALVEPRAPEEQVLRAIVAEEVCKLPPAEPGKDATPPSDAELAALIGPAVERAVAAIEKPQDGRSVTVDDLRPLVVETVSASLAEAVAAIPAPKDGAPGKDGKLPLVKAWEDRVYYEGEVATFDGSTYQAQSDTGRAPPHSDWLCIASSGRDGTDGADGRSLRIRGTYSEATDDYLALDIVALNGASFAAKRDNPGQCPGEDWQLVAAQGKRGQQGEARKGDPGPRGPAGPGVVALAVDGEGLVTLVNGDGSEVEVDLHPVLSKLG
jgi:hypothetical protein